MLSIPTKAERQSYLSGVLKQRGPAAAKRLEDGVMDLFRERAAG